MEGVLVNAKKEGSTVTTTVVSNDKGEFSFPAGKLGRLVAIKTRLERSRT